VAAILLLVFGGTYFYNRTTASLNNTIPDTVYKQNAIILETGQQKLILSEEGQLHLNDEKGNIVGNQQGNHLVYYKDSINSGLTQYNTLRIPYGKRFYVELSDGSSVTLNAGSTLRYPVSFTGSNKR